MILRDFFGLLSYRTCSKKMPGSLGHEEQDAKTFAEWVSVVICYGLIDMTYSCLDVVGKS
jgi:hypothetical protein